MTAIWWIRRDLRLTDNPTLHGASEPFDQTQDKAGEVVPVFYIEGRAKLVMDRRCPRHQVNQHENLREMPQAEVVAHV